MKKTVLFVDDDAKRGGSLADFLQEEYKVLLVDKTGDALKLIREGMNDIDLVILDIMMPPGELGKERTDNARRTGLVLLREIRNASPKIPVVIFTVVRDPQLRAEALRSGAVLYLEKPMLPSDLISRIDSIIGR